VAERSQARLRRDGWLIAAVGLVARLAVVGWAWGRFGPTADGFYYHRLATRIAEGHGYTWLWPDGVVTNAAHYPVGYSAALGAVYAVFGAHPELAMLLNALVGAAGCLAVHRLLMPYRVRWVAACGGLLVALHPGLVGYTPALMTGGVAAALVACAAWAVSASRRVRGRRQLLAWFGSGALLGLCVLIRPQCLLLAPLFAVAAVRPAVVMGTDGRAAAPPVLRAKLLAVATVCAGVVLICAPWTVRNCVRMGQCAPVSVNGGWNLLIGTDQSAGGSWAPLKVPPACRQVFDEAEKDRCFAGAARRRIVADPFGWLALVPAKLSSTFDYCGAAGWYLHEANRVAFDKRAKLVLGVAETIFERLVLLLALIVCLPSARLRPHKLADRGRVALVCLGVGASLSPYGWVAHLALLAALLWRRPGRSWRAPPLFACAAALLGCLMLVHAIFFGAGRYQLLLLPFTCALAALGAMRFGSIARALIRAKKRNIVGSEAGLTATPSGNFACSAWGREGIASLSRIRRVPMRL